MTKCKKCNTKLETYYEIYCPKCDIKKIIKGKNRSIAIIPLLNYGVKYVEGFTEKVKDTIWEDIIEEGSNDSYQDYYVGEDFDGNYTKEGKLFIKLLEAVGIKYNPKKGLFIWISW